MKIHVLPLICSPIIDSILQAAEYMFKLKPQIWQLISSIFDSIRQAAEYMFKLKPQIWQLKSLMLNISLIERIRRSNENDEEKRVSEASSFERESVLFQVRNTRNKTLSFEQGFGSGRFYGRSRRFRPSASTSAKM